MSDFPSHFKYTHPYGIEDLPESIYVCDFKALDQFSEEEFPRHYRDFLAHQSQVLSAVAEKMTMQSLKDWTISLKGKRAILEHHFYGEYTPGPVNFVGLSEMKNLPEWKNNWPGFGYSLELLTPEELADGLPIPLRELYSLGRLYLFGYPGSGYFYRPAEIKDALDEEYLGDFLREIAKDSPDTSTDGLKVFYTSSGSWLMYNEQEEVYCGGYECGDYYNSGLKLDQVIERIFALILAGERLNIESFAPKPETKL